MRNGSLVAAAVVVLMLTPRPAQAWGFAGHRLIMARAIELLPSELKPFFQRFKDQIVVRVIDPDLWRNVGWDDDPNHFVDFGMPELGPYPFAGLPRDRDKALEKFGVRVMDRVGYLPWREAEMFGNLRRAFEGFSKQAPYATSDVALFAAVASHYIQDAHQPFHASNNYDGQLTGNGGIHARFERDLVERFEPRLTLAPAPPAAIANPRDFAFQTLLDSYLQVDAILKADSEAVAGKDLYDDDYFEKFFTKVKPILDRQLSLAISATAGVIIGSWEAAGKPAIRTSDDRTPQKVKK
jgi:hypothetical protein